MQSGGDYWEICSSARNLMVDTLLARPDGLSCEEAERVGKSDEFNPTGRAMRKSMSFRPAWTARSGTNVNRDESGQLRILGMT
jgi:hypothetical protein